MEVSKSSIVDRSGTARSDKTDGQQARKVDTRPYREGTQIGQQFGGKMNRIEKLKKNASVSENGLHMQSRWVIKP